MQLVNCTKSGKDKQGILLNVNHLYANLDTLQHFNMAYMLGRIES